LIFFLLVGVEIRRNYFDFLPLGWCGDRRNYFDFLPLGWRGDKMK